MKDQPKYIWKHTKYDELQPITRFKEVKEADPNRMLRENVHEKDDQSAAQMTKITKFKKNNETSEKIIKHAKLLQQNPSDDKKENKTEE